MEKDIRNADAVAYKLEPALTRVINYRLEVVTEERRKREAIVERRKAKAITSKQYRARGGISLSSEKKDESDTRNNIDLDQVNDKYPLQL